MNLGRPCSDTGSSSQSTLVHGKSCAYFLRNRLPDHFACFRFVHEQWMTPSLFTCASGQKISEIDIASGWGNTTSARALLERHWDTFINETDFERLAAIGINTVRLPIGYWNLPSQYSKNTPFESVSDVYQNSWQHVLKAINMAANVSIGVLVDLHGAPGSQNGTLSFFTVCIFKLYVASLSRSTPLRNFG